MTSGESKVNGGRRPATRARQSTHRLKEFPTVDEEATRLLEEEPVEQFLAMLAAEVLVLLVHSLIKLVFGFEMPRPRGTLAA